MKIDVKIQRLLLIAMLILAGVARAEDAFFVLPVKDVQLTEGSLPVPATQPDSADWHARGQMHPYAVIDGGEGFFLGEDGQSDANGRTDPIRICVRAPAGQPVNGRMYLLKSDSSGMSAVKFSIPPDQAKPDARKSFYQAQLQHYRQLLDDRAPGAAWFRFRADEAARALGKDIDPATVQRPSSDDEVDETYNLFTGGRAVSENLQLDRAIAMAKDEKRTVDISSIKGLEVAEIDWTPLIKDLHPQADPLASLIPFDQHAILFPSFDSFVKVMDLADQQGTPVLQYVEPRSEDSGTKARYQRQLGLDMSALSKILGPAMVDGVAITGSDPYLRVGADVAILLQTKSPDALAKLLQAKIALSTAGSHTKHNDGDTEGLHFTSYQADDRSVSVYLATTDGAVIVTNSPAQLANLGRAIAKKMPVLSGTPEYTFFRNRYPRGDTSESAFVILTDATIRRWCGPRWRIADSRRTRAAAILSDLQARNVDSLMSGRLDTMAKPSEGLPESLGDVTLTSVGARSSVYGSLDFLTPISELSIDKVTAGEQQAYERWRDQYQQYWRWAFDPIAARITADGKALAMDVSVMPLIAGSDYDTLIHLTSGVELSPDAGDPHADLLHAVMAINIKSEEMHDADSFFSSTVQSVMPNPLSWIGPSIAVYVDDDPFWAEVAKQKPEEMDQFMQKSFGRVPIGLQIDSNSPLKLVAFITMLRAWVEQAAPQMTVWQPVQYNGRSYVKISPTEQARQGQRELEHVAIYYAATPTALIISPNEKVIQSALDRQAARSGKPGTTQPVTQPAQPATQPVEPWLGKSAAIRARRSVLDLLQTGFHDDYVQMLRQSSWANLPILNEWKRRFPTEDPLMVHQRLWDAKLLCPGGGAYVWNEQDQTMESTVFGSPSTPKNPAKVPQLLQGFGGFEGGISFENKGLRARARLERTEPIK